MDETLEAREQRRVAREAELIANLPPSTVGKVSLRLVGHEGKRQHIRIRAIIEPVGTREGEPHLPL